MICQHAYYEFEKQKMKTVSFYAFLALFLTFSDAQTISTIYVNTTTVGITPQTSDPIFRDFKKSDVSDNVGLGGQVLFQFNVRPSDHPTNLRMSTCDGSEFDTYLVLFDRDPNDFIAKTNENRTIVQNATAIAESANDILCDESNDHAALFVTLNKGTYYVLLTGDGAAHGKFNLTLSGTPKFETTISPWHLDRIDQRDLPMNNEYSVTNPAEDILVYLIDSGVNIDHEEFEGRVRVGYDFVRYTEAGTPDCTGHGTHLAGLIAGKTYGVAKKASIVSLRVYDCSNRASVTAIVNALHWVLAHSKSSCFLNRCVVALMVANHREPSSVMESVLEGFVQRQIPVIVPAGNHDDGIGHEGDACDVFPAAKYPEFLVVGATSRTDGRASFSNGGPCVDLYAPGVGITSAWHSSNNAVASMSGTTQASAIVAGVTAVLLSINNGLSAPVAQDFLSSVSTPNVVTSMPEDANSRLVYVRSVPTDRQRIPQEGFVLLRLTVKANFTSCGDGDPRLKLFRETLSEITKVNVNNIEVACEPIEPVNSRAIAWNFTDSRAKLMMLSLRQRKQAFNIEVVLTVTERKVSSAFVRLERKVESEKEDFEETVVFGFEVTNMPWAIDSREIVYWGAPTFVVTETEGRNVGIIIAIVMAVILVICVIGVTAWLWHRRITRKDEIVSMVGSADMERGPVEFRDYDDDDDRKLKVRRSFRNQSGLKGSNEPNESKSKGLTSISSFIGKDSSAVDNSMRIHSFGPEAFAGMNTLSDGDDAKNEAENDDNWRENNIRPLNSTVAGNDNDDSSQMTMDDLMVKSLDGEAFAMIMDMESQGDIVLGEDGNDSNGNGNGNRDDTNPSSSPGAGGSNVGGDEMMLMELEPGERMVMEDNIVAMSPRGQASPRMI